MHSPPHYQYSSLESYRVTCVTTDKPVLKYHNHLKSTAGITIHSWYCTSIGLDMYLCIMTCLHHYCITQCIFTAIEASMLHLFILPPLIQHLSMTDFFSFLYCLHSFSFFQNVIYFKLNLLKPLQIGLFHSVICYLSSLHVFS